MGGGKANGKGDGNRGGHWEGEMGKGRALKKEGNSLVCNNSEMTENALYFSSSFWKFNFLAVTEEREVHLITSISKQCMESCQFPSAHTVISGRPNYSKRPKLSLLSQTSELLEEKCWGSWGSGGWGRIGTREGDRNCGD